MGKQDYREAIEKGRQEINVHSNSAPSRRAYRKTAKEKPKKKKSILLPTLFFLFILIPVSILIYVAFLYEPNDTLTASSVNNEVSLESQAPETPLVPMDSELEDSEDDQAAQEEKEAEQQAKEKEAAEKAAAEKEAAAKEQAQKEAAAKEQAKKEQAEKEAAAKAQAQREREQAEAKRQQEKAAAEQKKAQEEKASASKTHTVQAGETLYRIAVNTYGASGASAGVEKIKQANGLSSNEITVGSTLILP